MRPSRELAAGGDESPDAPLLASIDPEIVPLKRNSFRNGLPSMSQIGHYIRASKNEAKRRPMNFCLGCCGCLMVVFISALLISVLSKAPVIFARLSELEVGETDVILTSDNGLSLNYTQIQRALHMQNLEFPSSPRSRIIVQLYNARNCFHTSNRSDSGGTDHLWNCTDNPECYAMSCSQNELGLLLLLDSAKEAEIGVGSAWKYSPLTDNNINMQKNLAQYLGVEAGDQVLLLLQLSQYYGRAYQLLVDSYWGTLRASCRKNSRDPSCALLKYEIARRRVWPLVYLALNVSVIYSEPLGKHASEQEDTILMEMEAFSRLISRSLHPDIPPEIRSVLQATVAYDHVQSVIFNLPQPRQLLYAQSDFSRVRDRVTAYAGQISYAVGFSQQVCEVPVLESLEGKVEMSVLLRLVLNIIVLSLVVLSSLLIHSLLAVSVDTRTFELGVLRMLGMRRTGVVLLVLTQAISYAVPALVVGLSLASLIGVYMSEYFHSLTAIRLSPRLSLEGVCTAIGLATAVPLFSALGPVMGALSSNVAEGAASRRPPGPTMRQYVLTRAEDSIDSTPLLVGGLCTVLGFLIYFGLPYSLVSVNLSLLFNILFGLLMCMLLGLVLLTLNVEHLTERVVLALFLFWERATVRAIVQKNLTAHRIRNRKTTIVYSLSLSFILFVSVSYSTQISALYYTRQKADGAFVRVDTASSSSITARASSYGFTPAVMDRLEQFATANSKYIGGYGWRAKMTTRSDGRMSNLGHSFTEDAQLYGVSPNLLSGFIEGFLDVESGPTDFAEALYEPRGSASCALSTSASETIGATVGEPFLLTLVERQENGTEDHVRALRPLSLVSGCASFAFSSYPNRPGTAVVTSFPTLAKLLPGVQSVDEIPMTSFYIDIDPNTLSKSAYNSLLSELYDIVRKSPGLFLSEYAKRGQLIKMINLAMGFFFNFATVCAMAVCFFSLMSSMYTNIHEQTHEIGILQALGLPVSWLRRIYIFEAFVLIITASLMGIAVGTAVAWSLVLQQVMLLDIPLPFSFPWSTLGAVFVSAILFAVMASLGPTNTVVRRPIVENLRFVG